MSGNRNRQPGKVGQKHARLERRRVGRERRRWLTIGAAVLGLLAVAAFARFAWSRPRPQPVSAARLADDPSLGSPEALVTIVEYGDFGCPACRAWHQSGIFDRVRAQYGDRVRFVWRDFPVITAQSPKAAEAGQCAYDQGEFWEYHDLVFARSPAIGVRDLKAYAAEIGLETEAFNQCLDSGQHRATVDRDLKDAFAHNFRGTPSFLVNEQPLAGPPSFEYLQSLIDPLIASGG